jgi:proteasome lid subunit RPN8/RPN11
MEGLEKIVMTKIEIPAQLIDETLVELQNAGAQNRERVVLWLGSRNGNRIEIAEIFVPIQQTASDYFRIPREGMAQLMRHLRERDLMIAAQVHSHPEEAYHSKADDYWAIVRHVGALSLVLPNFAVQIDRHSFVTHTAVFELSIDNRWIEVPQSQVTTCYSLIS